MKKTAIELFAGVGGFRVGLNHVTLGQDGKAIEKPNFHFVWANQWEPSTKSQDAFECYKFRFSKENSENEFSNIDISLVDKSLLPDFNLLTGGFPCQDYSVARSLSKEKGIEGKKGVLWWEINDVLKHKNPPFVLLENVDRLLKSPSKQRGRDFGIMLRTLADNDYSVEWRVINAAEYGFPQRRRRIYIFAYKNNTKYSQYISNLEPHQVLSQYGFFSQKFPIQSFDTINSGNVDNLSFADLVQLSNNFHFDFFNSGYMNYYKIYTTKTQSIQNEKFVLDKVILHDIIEEKYFLNEKQIGVMEFLKGAKKIPRKALSGHIYNYSEGAMSFPDRYDVPGRTMLTSEGKLNRSTHVVEDRNTKRLRFLTPIECERLNQFPDNWTNTMSEQKRYFMMGNALVTGVIQKMGNTLERIIDEES